MLNILLLYLNNHNIRYSYYYYAGILT